MLHSLYEQDSTVSKSEPPFSVHSSSREMHSSPHSAHPCSICWSNKYDNYELKLIGCFILCHFQYYATVGFIFKMEIHRKFLQKMANGIFEVNLWAQCGLHCVIVRALCQFGLSCCATCPFWRHQTAVCNDLFHKRQEHMLSCRAFKSKGSSSRQRKVDVCVWVQVILHSAAVFCFSG